MGLKLRTSDLRFAGLASLGGRTRAARADPRHEPGSYDIRRDNHLSKIAKVARFWQHFANCWRARY